MKTWMGLGLVGLALTGGTIATATPREVRRDSNSA